jgi:hypothetical protein
MPSCTKCGKVVFREETFLGLFVQGPLHRLCTKAAQKLILHKKS